MNGFRAELLGRVLGVNGHATVVSRPGRASPTSTPLAERLRQAPGVVGVMPYVEGQVMASANGVASGALVRGVRPDGPRAARGRSPSNVLDGSLDGSGRAGNAPRSAAAWPRGWGCGSAATITLISPKGRPRPWAPCRASRPSTSAAIFEIGMYEYDNSFVYIPLADAQAYFQLATG